MMDRNNGSPNDCFEVRLSSTSDEIVNSFIRRFEIDTGCTSLKCGKDGTTVVGFVQKRFLDQIISEQQEQSTRDDSETEFSIEVLENVSATTHRRLAQVGKGNRFADPASVVSGLGSKE